MADYDTRPSLSEASENVESRRSAMKGPREVGRIMLDSRDQPSNPDELMVDIDALTGDMEDLERWMEMHTLSEVRFAMLSIEDNVAMHQRRAEQNSGALDTMRRHVAAMADVSNRTQKVSPQDFAR